MKRQDWSPALGPVIAMACRCSTWPIATAFGRIGRCGECRVRPRPIPHYEELP